MILYETVVSYYSSSLKYLDQESAAKIIISALSCNLGMIIAQFPEDLQENYRKIATHVLNQSVLETTEQISASSYGAIGHA